MIIILLLFLTQHNKNSKQMENYTFSKTQLICTKPLFPVNAFWTHMFCKSIQAQLVAAWLNLWQPYLVSVWRQRLVLKLLPRRITYVTHVPQLSGLKAKMNETISFKWSCLFFPIKRNNVNLGYVDPNPNTLDHNKWCRVHPHKNTHAHTHTEHGLTLAWNQGWFPSRCRTRCRPLGSISRGNSEKMCTPWFSSLWNCPRILFFIQFK